MKRYLMLFESTRAVITAERLCKQYGIVCKIIPVPRSVSSECGMAIEYNVNDRNTIDNIVFQEKLTIQFYVWEKVR